MRIETLKEGDWKTKKEYCSNHNCTCTLFTWFMWALASSDKEFIHISHCPIHWSLVLWLTLYKFIILDSLDQDLIHFGLGLQIVSIHVKMALTASITTSIYKHFIIKFIIVLPLPPNYGLPELQPNHIEWINHIKNKNNKFSKKKIKTIEH